MDLTPSNVEKYVKNLKVSLLFTNPKGDGDDTIATTPYAFYMNLKAIQRKLPDNTAMCPVFEVKKGQSRMDAWQIFLDGVRAYLRTIGMELVDILDAGKFAPPYPTLLPEELQEWLSPEDRAMYCGKPEESDDNGVNDDVDEEIFSPAQTARGNMSNSSRSRKSNKAHQDH